MGTLGAPGQYSTAFAEHRTASGVWRVDDNLPSPVIANVTSLSGVSCATTTSCVAVGGWTYGALIERWNGTTWHLQSAPSGIVDLSAVSCWSASGCMAVGGTRAAVFNGGKWRSVSALPSAISAATGISCTSAHACTAVGGFAAARWNGAAWRVEHLASPGARLAARQLSSVACATATRCTAVGYDGYDNLVHDGFVYGTLIESWNGSKWSLQPSFNTTSSQFNGVSCPPGGHCTAAGFTETGPLAERFNGARWLQTDTASAPNGDFAAISCRSATICTAVGSTSTGTPIERESAAAS